MQPSSDASADATADRVSRLQGLTSLGGQFYTSASSEETPRALGERSAPAVSGKSAGLGANCVEGTESTEFLAALMQEAPGGANFGRAASSSRDPETERHLSLGVDDAQAREFMSDGGWGIGTIKDGSRAGIHAHRGVLRGDEHIDVDAVLRAVEDELGFTIDEIHSVYRQGRMTDSQRELRGRIDARLLALSRSGANMAALARLFGFTYNESRQAYDTMERALARAREAEHASICDRCGRDVPAVVSPCWVCP